MKPSTITRPDPVRPPCWEYCHAGRIPLPVPDQALALPGGTHHGLDHAGQADLRHGLAEAGLVVGEAVGRGRQAEFLGGQPADALAVHRQVRGPGGGDHAPALAFELQQRRGRDGLDLGHDQPRVLAIDQRRQGGAVEHVDHVAAVRHLHRRRTGIAVHGDHLDPEALRLDGHFLAEFAGAEQQQAGGAGGARGSEGHERRAFMVWRRQ
jgi:hypothetical protein